MTLQSPSTLVGLLCGDPVRKDWRGLVQWYLQCLGSPRRLDERRVIPLRLLLKDSGSGRPQKGEFQGPGLTPLPSPDSFRSKLETFSHLHPADHMKELKEKREGERFLPFVLLDSYGIYSSFYGLPPSVSSILSITTPVLRVHVFISLPWTRRFHFVGYLLFL